MKISSRKLIFETSFYSLNENIITVTQNGVSKEKFLYEVIGKKLRTRRLLDFALNKALHLRFDDILYERLGDKTPQVIGCSPKAIGSGQKE